MAKDVVDIRKLKDEVTEHLKKQKWEKAAEVLEKLVKAEPKDMSHRLKLGDTYRRQEQIQKAIQSYQHAARFFGDEGQLIKAIGAVKVILEIDPKNEEAQKQLAEMNERRLGKVTLENSGLKRGGPGIGAGARGTTAQELEEAARAAHEVASAIEVKPGEDDEPLELDDGKPTPPRRGVAPGGGPVLPKKPPPPRTVVPPAPKPVTYELGGEGEFDLESMAVKPEPPKSKHPPIAPPPPAPPKRAPEVELDLDMMDAGGPAKLPDDAILTPQAEDLVASADEDEITLDDELKPPEPQKPAAPKPPPPPAVVAPPPPAAPRPPPPPPAAVTVSDEITFEEDEAPKAAPPPRTQRPPPGPGGSQPIADLLSSESEEEIELLSMSSDEEVSDRPFANAKTTTPDEADLDRAFGGIAPASLPQPKKVPAKKVPLFDDLSQEAFVELVNKVAYHRHVPGQLIIKEGDPGRSFYVIVEGKVRIYKVGPDEKEITLAHLGEGAFFGEMALLSGAPRTANVVAEEDTEILEVTDVVLRDLAEKYPQVVNSLKNFYRQRLLNNVMAISPLFKDFDPGERKSIVEKFRMKQAAPNEVLITEGKNSDGLYVVMHGGVSVAAKKGEAPVELARLKEGEIFGEMSLLTRRPATATVTSTGNSILLRLPRENFQELVLTHPQILELVSELTEKRKSATEAILHGQGPGHDGMSFV